MDIEIDIEMLHCGMINVENLGRLVPGLVGHPIYQLALHQLRLGLAETQEEKGALQADFEAKAPTS